MKRYAKIMVFVLIFLAIAAGAVWLSAARRSELKDMARPEAPAYAVHVATAEKGALAVTREFVGIVEPVDQAAVAFRMTGEVVSADREAGDRVSENEVIASIDDRPLVEQKRGIAAELAGAESDLARAEKQVQRRRPLLAKKLIDPEAMDTAEFEFEAAKARVDNLKSRLASAELNLAYTTVSAPFDGIITTRHKQKGDLVMPGEPVYTVENPDAGYKVTVQVPRETALAVAPGARATVRFNTRTLETTLYRIFPSTQKGRLAVAELRLEKRPFGLPSGTFVTVDLLIETTEGLRVPAMAVLEDGTGARVFRIGEEDRVEIIDVTVVARKGKHAIIEGPVSPGDRLVTAEESMMLRLSDRTRVRPMDALNGGDMPR
ncbi:MAG: efflux RND transporter periplasmic adaptor subunit [Desulfosalsimonadaceae bacterium]